MFPLKNLARKGLNGNLREMETHRVTEESLTVGKEEMDTKPLSPDFEVYISSPSIIKIHASLISIPSYFVVAVASGQWVYV